MLAANDSSLEDQDEKFKTLRVFLWESNGNHAEIVYNQRY